MYVVGLGDSHENMVYLLFSYLQIPKMMYIGKYALCGVCVDQFGSFYDVHMLFGLACILLLMESMQSLFEFAQWGDIFMSDFIVVVKVSQG